VPAANSRQEQLKRMIEAAREAGLEVTGIEIQPRRIYLTTKSRCCPEHSEHDDEYARMKAELLR
jgi:multimeric flavodoxin WrbA